MSRLNTVDIKSWIKTIYDAKNLIMGQTGNKPILKIIAPSRTIRRGSVVGKHLFSDQKG
jgi:hypothetical protein